MRRIKPTKAMSIIQTRKQSDIEKRLKLLRQQVYGKGSEYRIQKTEDSNQNPTKSEQNLTSSEQKTEEKENLSSVIRNQSSVLSPLSSDITYLHYDLIKITSFAAIAFAAQFILFYMLTNNILKLPF